MNRLCGHTAGPIGYSFARHAVYVSKHVEDTKLALKALMLNAHKSLSGDIASPARNMLVNMGYSDTLNDFENKLRRDVFYHFDVPVLTDQDKIDLDPILERAHASELRDVVGVKKGEPFEDTTSAMDARDSAAEFVARYNELVSKD
jgi:hypothetical protein